MGMKEVQEQLIENMKRWQKIEVASVASTYKVMEETENPVISLVMEVIQRDSQMHHKVQGYILSTLTEKSPELNPEELAGVWESIQKHNELEKQMVSNVKEALGALKGKHMVVQEYMLNYLLEDEKKHEMLLESLDKIKAGMYPYGS